MPLRVLVIGLVAAAAAVVPQWAWHLQGARHWIVHPVSFAAVAAISALWARGRGGKPFQGLPGLLRHVHATPSEGAHEPWLRRAFISLFASVTGGPVGPEGAAIELAQEIGARAHGPSTRWFEAFRRTDVTTSLAAGVAAAFQAPFAAVLLPVELGVGGRILPSVGGALVGYIGARAGWDLVGLPPLIPASVPVSHLADLAWEADHWLTVLPAVIGGIALGCAFLLFHGQAVKNLHSLAARSPGWAAFAPSAILVALALAASPVSLPAPTVFNRLVLGGWEASSLGPLLVTLFLGTVLAAAGFGTAGILWPLFVLGAVGGWIASGWAGAAGPLPALAGAAAIWGAALGAPVSGSLIAFELTGDPAVLAVCLCAGWFAREARAFLAGPALVERILGDAGIEVRDGRSLAVLSSLKVRQAMVADQTVVGEHEPVSRLIEVLTQSRYPFLCVITAGGKFVGLLTADVVHSASLEQGSGLLEAKDLIYRAGLKVRAVTIEDSLVVTSGVFHRTPVVPVLGDQQQVAGLLFDHNVRIAYEQEVARRSLAFRVTTT